MFVKKASKMWQKFLYSVFFIIITGICTQVYAKTVEVTALDSISTEKPSKSVSVKLLDTLEIAPGQMLNSGVVLTGQLVDVKSPKRLKRNAGFSFKPVSYTDVDGSNHKITSNIKALYTTTLDKGHLAKSAALGVGNHFVKGLSMGLAAVEGAVKNEEGNRIKSSAVSVYEASPLSYVEKGEELNIGVGQNFYLKFPDIQPEEVQTNDDDVKGQNYSYTIEKE